MRHIFIINPTAGKRNCTAVLMEMARPGGPGHGLQVECILTKSQGYATEAVKSIAASGRGGALLRLVAATAPPTRWQMAWWVWRTPL